MSTYNDGEDVEQQQRLIDGDDSEQCDGRTPVRSSFTALHDILLMGWCSWTRLLTVLVWGATNGLYYRFADSVSPLLQSPVFLKHDISWLGWMADNVCFVRLFN